MQRTMGMTPCITFFLLVVAAFACVKAGSSGCQKDCQHGGRLDEDLCRCDCTGHWSGEFCHQCPLVCQNGGVMDYGACKCSCQKPYTGAMCHMVGCSLECQNGGKQAENGQCKCECPEGTKGALCEQREDWCYDDDSCGPANWGGLSPDFSLCAKGDQQSPVDIQEANVVKTPELPEAKFRYKAGRVRVLNTGKGIQLEFSGSGHMEYGGKRYDLVQAHFHRPGEHRINGKNAEMEMHIVNQSADEQFLVVAILFEESDQDNIILNRFWDTLPTATGSSTMLKAPLNPVNFMSETQTHQFYEYAGSLSTPPCVEGVKNLVLLKPGGVSRSQLKKLEEVVPFNNNRPVQALSRMSRRIYKYVGVNSAFHWAYDESDSSTSSGGVVEQAGGEQGGSGSGTSTVDDDGLAMQNDTIVFPGYTCQNGAHQSPVNLGETLPRGAVNHHPRMLALMTSYMSMKPNLATSHFLETLVDSAKNSLTYVGEKYQLESIRFHSPALHTVNRRESEMEIVFVHRNDDGPLYVSVLVEKGAEHASAKMLLGSQTSEGEVINPADFLPENPNFYAYDGSEYVDPCTEGVKWIVMKEAIKFSSEQIWQYFQRIPSSTRVRRVQPLNKRLIISTQFPEEGVRALGKPHNRNADDDQNKHS